MNFYNPLHFRIILKDLLRIRSQNLQNEKHLKLALRFLGIAQDVTCDGGLSYGYSLRQGWKASYPEVTGYTIPILVNCYRMKHSIGLLERITKMADFLINNQLPSGAFRGLTVVDSIGPIVFNTGQCLQGLSAAFELTKNQKYLLAAIKAADWLLSVQSEDGAFRHFEYNNLPRSYHSRVAWPLLQLWLVTGEKKYMISATRNLNRVLKDQHPNGWFSNCSLPDCATLTHTIAYTIEGLLESGLILNQERYLKAAYDAAIRVLTTYTRSQRLFPAFDQEWECSDRYVCLTACAQMAFIFLRLFEIYGKNHFLSAGFALNSFIESFQLMGTEIPMLRGAIQASHPIWSGYLKFLFPSWTVSFFLNALLLEKRLKQCRED